MPSVYTGTICNCITYPQSADKLTSPKLIVFLHRSHVQEMQHLVSRELEARCSYVHLFEEYWTHNLAACTGPSRLPTRRVESLGYISSRPLLRNRNHNHTTEDYEPLRLEESNWHSSTKLCQSFQHCLSWLLILASFTATGVRSKLYTWIAYFKKGHKHQTLSYRNSILLNWKMIRNPFIGFWIIVFLPRVIHLLAGIKFHCSHNKYKII